MLGIKNQASNSTTEHPDTPDDRSEVEQDVSFRPHHLRPQGKLASSFSSMSSYSSDSSDGEDQSSTSIDQPSFIAKLKHEAVAAFAPSSSSLHSPAIKSHSRARDQRPGGGTLLRPAGKAHDWYSGGKITTHGRWFRDSQNRTLLLRGVNLCGNSKLPTTPNGSTHLSDGFFDHRNVCFLGRPFPRDQADEHFSRLKRWGLTFVRLLVPWEALEHSGPGIYDEKFIDSLIELMELMPKYGIKCFIDPHQDCWSRFSGGSGAPGWTFEAAGLDITKFKTTGAAYVHNTNQYPGDSPPMVWPTNYTKLAASTMFTLFWAGDTFAPNKVYQGESIQQFLQNRYIECYQHLARRVSHLDAVVGFEVMNEPHPGYIGLKDLKRYDFNTNLFFGDFPSALEGFALGDGMALPIEVWVKSWPYPTRKERTRIINSDKESAWLDGECLWKQHGVWSVNPKTGTPQLDKPDYFTKDPATGEKIDFTRFYLNFINKYSQAIQSVTQSAFVFVGPIPNEPAPVWGPKDHEENIVYAPHWYDLHSIFNKSFDGRVTHDVQGLSKGQNVISATYFGINGAKKNYRGQLSNVLKLGLQNVGTKPCLIGECGIPMDINQRKAFLSGDYGYHSKFLDAVLSAMEANLLSFTLWNYNATNDNMYGDHWNGEDFSIFSLDSPRPSPRVSRGCSPDPSRTSLRQQAPNFAKEVIRRAAAQNAASIDTPTIDSPDATDVENYSLADNEGSDTTRDGTRSETDGVEMAAEDSSPFDRSYLSFDHEESYDGPDHEEHLGGRALDAVVRPYAAKVAGEPISSEFDFNTLQYTFRFCNYIETRVPTVHVIAPEQERRDTSAPSLDSVNLDGPTMDNLRVVTNIAETSPIWFGHPPGGTVVSFETELYIPSYHYDDTGLEILVSDGDWRYVKERQTLYYRHHNMEQGAVHSIRIKPVSSPVIGTYSAAKSGPTNTDVVVEGSEIRVGPKGGFPQRQDGNFKVIGALPDDESSHTWCSIIRNRGGTGTTFVNNVRGPTSALTSFLNERGIRRANPAPAPAPEPAPQSPATSPEQQDEDDDNDEDEDEAEEEEEPAIPVASSSRSTRTARLTRGRTTSASTVTVSSNLTRSKPSQVGEDDGSGDDDDDDDSDEEDGDDYAVKTTSVRLVRSTRSQVRVTVSSSSAASSKATTLKAAPSKATTPKAASSKVAATLSKKRPRKKGSSDDSDDPEDKDFHDITGYVQRSNFSHKGRMPQGTNKIEFCSRCRARFTIKAGTTPTVDEDSGGLLCPTCADSSSSASNSIPKARPVKRLRRKMQKVEIENQIPSLQDLCIKKIAGCIEDVEALGDISDLSLDKICRIISRNRSLTDNTVQLFLDSRHTDLSLYDCTDITSTGLVNIAQFCPNLRSLKLKFCGRIDNTVMEYYTEHLTHLSSFSLIGPILITEATYIKFFEAMGDKFEKFELKHSSRFSLKALKALCENCPNLTHLRLGDCNLMDDEWMEVIANLTKLRSLRIRNPERDRVTTQPVVKLIQAVGSGLEELELKGCVGLEDPVLVDAIRPSCVRLDRLNISGCEELTTEAIENLFKDWTNNRGLNYVNLENCIMLSDEALKAITSHSAETLEILNIKGLDELTKESLLTIARCENLTSLDASWCRAMDDDVMSQLVEKAPRLTKVNVWGNHRLTECCPSRKGMKIIGREGDYLDLKFI
ncbi:hypothetical protein BGX27_011232 [Mortierella sp. AM989]|nr:hypothetical protein BGX27_011232 [Mortierella sp. AM989]